MINRQARWKGDIIWQSFGDVTHVEAARQFSQRRLSPGLEQYVETRDDGSAIWQTHRVRMNYSLEVVPIRRDRDDNSQANDSRPTSG